MVEVRHSADCGNSPKNRFAEEYVIALLTGDVRTLQNASIADFPIERVAQMPSAIEIDHVVRHGKVGAVSGAVASGGRKTGFCFVIVFTSVRAERVSKITRYNL